MEVNHSLMFVRIGWCTVGACEAGKRSKFEDRSKLKIRTVISECLMWISNTLQLATAQLACMLMLVVERSRMPLPARPPSRLVSARAAPRLSRSNLDTLARADRSSCARPARYSR
jgi:hypothetical protein